MAIIIHDPSSVLFTCSRTVSAAGKVQIVLHPLSAFRPRERLAFSALSSLRARHVLGNFLVISVRLYRSELHNHGVAFVPLACNYGLQCRQVVGYAVVLKNVHLEPSHFSAIYTSFCRYIASVCIYQCPHWKWLTRGILCPLRDCLLSPTWPSWGSVCTSLSARWISVAASLQVIHWWWRRCLSYCRVVDGVESLRK